MKHGIPSFWVVLVMSLIPLVVVGAFAGIQVRDDPDAIVATTLFIVAIVDLLGLVRYIAYGAERRQRDWLLDVYRARAGNDDLKRADRDDAQNQLFDLEATNGDFDGAWMLLPHLAASGFGVAMAIAAHAGG